MNDTNNTTLTLTPNQINIIKILSLSSSTASIILILVFLFHIFVQTIRKRAFFKYMSLRLLTYIEICAMMASISDFYGLGISNGEPLPFCIIQAFQTQFFSLAVLLWTLCLSLYMTITIVLNYGGKRVLLEIFFHIFVWLLSALGASLPFIGSTYGKGTIWCYIKLDTRLGKIWVLSVFYVPVWIIITIVFLLYLRVIIFLIQRRHQELTYKASNQTTYYLLLAYPAVFLISWIFPTIKRVIESYATVNLEVSFGLNVMHALTLRMQGTLNVVVYMLVPVDSSNTFTERIRTILVKLGLLRQSPYLKELDVKFLNQQYDVEEERFSSSDLKTEIIEIQEEKL